jgi:S-adenosylmethionine hydrolase
LPLHSNDPLITLTTDFGGDSPYVAAMKGVVLGINPRARLVDLSHQVPPQDVRYAAFFLAASIPFFPVEAIHVVVVDPGVGSERALLYIEIEGRRVLAPDNGCWTSLLGDGSGPARIIRLAEPRYWRQPVSSTFHGRDILAPVAGHLSIGVDPALLGPPASDWVRLAWPQVRAVMDGLAGEVIFVDHFGNLISNIPGASIRNAPDILMIGKKSFRRGRGFQWVSCYAAAKPGTVVALISSQGLVEVAVVQGSAAAKLKVQVGTPVTIGWSK